MGERLLPNQAAMKHRIIVIFVIFAALMASSSHAGGLTVQRTFFTSWKYSVDGETYHKVGTQADDLRLMMTDYRACVSALNSYRSHMTAAKVTGAVTLLLLGYVTVSALRGGEWADGYTPAAIVGVSVGLASVALEASGSRSLKRAVRIYSQYTGQSSRQPAIDPGLRLSFKLSF